MTQEIEDALKALEKLHELAGNSLWCPNDADEYVYPIRNALEAFRDNQWQPIETAPRDGTVILGYDEEKSEYPEPMQWVDVGVWVGWVYQNEMLCDYAPNPTHWMPIKPPQEEKP